MSYRLNEYYEIGQQVLDNLTTGCNKVGVILSVTPKTVTVKHRGFKVKHSFKIVDHRMFESITDSLKLIK